ncbi:TPA: hypothetical protein ACGF8J_003511, partial [Vibrio cholerae]
VVSVVVFEFSVMRCQPLRRALCRLVCKIFMHLEEKMSNSKSIHIEQKQKFLNLLVACSSKTISIYSELKMSILSSCSCNDYGYTNKPDFRISNNYVMVELIPLKSDGVLIMVRVDSDTTYKTVNAPSLNIINPAKESGKPGTLWIEFTVNSTTQIPDAVRLISDAYKSRSVIGW